MQPQSDTAKQIIITEQCKKWWIFLPCQEDIAII